MQLTRNPKVILSVCSVFSLAVGATAGALVAKRQLEAKYAQLAEEEIEEAKQFYAVKTKHEFATPEEAVKKLVPEVDREADIMQRAIDAMRTYEGPLRTDYTKAAEVVEAEVETDGEEPVVTTSVTNIFVENEPLDVDVDWEAEVAARSTDKPYIITYEEFYRNEPEHEQTVLTYYEPDDTLADEKDDVVSEETTCGTGNLRFGFGSKDRNVVYIRNEQLNLDFEVVRSETSYVESVAGLTIRHSEYVPRPRRFRAGDDG